MNMENSFIIKLFFLMQIVINLIDTSSAKGFCRMFSRAKYDTLDLRNFNTSKVTDMMGMFGGANIKVIRLDSFDFSNVKYHGGNDYYNSSVNSYMFSNLNNDAVIYVKDVFSKNFVEERLHEAGKNNSVIIAS